MKLALKFALALFLGIFVVLAANAALRIQREKALFETDIQRDHGVLGDWLARAVEAIWSAAGEAKALAFLERANAEQTRLSVRWVRIDPSDEFPWRASGDHGSLDELAANQTVVVKQEKHIMCQLGRSVNATCQTNSLRNAGRGILSYVALCHHSATSRRSVSPPSLEFPAVARASAIYPQVKTGIMLAFEPCPVD